MGGRPEHVPEFEHIAGWHVWERRDGVIRRVSALPFGFLDNALAWARGYGRTAEPERMWVLLQNLRPA